MKLPPLLLLLLLLPPHSIIFSSNSKIINCKSIDTIEYHHFNANGNLVYFISKRSRNSFRLLLLLVLDDYCDFTFICNRFHRKKKAIKWRDGESKVEGQ